MIRLSSGGPRLLSLAIADADPATRIIVPDAARGAAIIGIAIAVIGIPVIAVAVIAAIVIAAAIAVVVVAIAVIAVVVIAATVARSDRGTDAEAENPGADRPGGIVAVMMMAAVILRVRRGRGQGHRRSEREARNALPDKATHVVTPGLPDPHPEKTQSRPSR